MASRRGRSPDRARPGEGNQRPAGGGRRRDRTPDAQHRPDAPRPEDRQARAQALRKQWMTKRHDKDGDGKLNDAERAAMAAEQAEQERRTREYREQAERRRKEQLAKYDGVGDGLLSDAERQAMQEALRREWQQRSQAMRQRQESLRKQADGDGDGKTSGQEWRDFWTKTRAK